MEMEAVIEWKDNAMTTSMNNRTMIMFLPGHFGLLTSIALAATLALGCHSTQEMAVVTGQTVFVIHGMPGAISGDIDPNWERPEPEPQPNEKLYWLRMDRENGNSLYPVDSDENGDYRIELPPGQYLVASETFRGWELERREKAGWTNTDTLIRALFDVWTHDEKGRPIFMDEPGMTVEAGQVYTQDVATSILCVD